MTELDLKTLRASVAGEGVAYRSRGHLQPAGGPGTKVFPPTYGVASGAATKYAIEEHTVGGRATKTVLLASVADQANRMELALLEGLESGDLNFPAPFVDFGDADGLVDIGRLSVLQAPHRMADAIFRDSLLDGTLFRLSDLGRKVTDATPNAATALYAADPHALVFGMWDSTGPKGGLGSKFERALVSEIVGEDAELGVAVGSRIDPLQIARTAATVYEAAERDQGWTLSEDEAMRDDKSKPVPVGKAGERGRPSSVNHGNVTPSIVGNAGGVTISRAVQSTVLSLAALRKLRFVETVDGEPLTGPARREAEIAARTALAALGIAAIAFQREQDYDLRSRCLLVPEEAPVLELLPRYGTQIQTFDLSSAAAATVLHEAAQAAAVVGMGWSSEQIRLVPAPKLCDLVRRSRAQLATTAPEQLDEA